MQITQHRWRVTLVRNKQFQFDAVHGGRMLIVLCWRSGILAEMHQYTQRCKLFENINQKQNVKITFGESMIILTPGKRMKLGVCMVACGRKSDKNHVPINE